MIINLKIFFVVCVAYGNYTAIVPNGPFRQAGLHHKLQENGEIIGDPFDVSSLRREDYQFHMGKDEQSDILQVQTVFIQFLTLFS